MGCTNRFSKLEMSCNGVARASISICRFAITMKKCCNTIKTISCTIILTMKIDCINRMSKSKMSCTGVARASVSILIFTRITLSIQKQQYTNRDFNVNFQGTSLSSINSPNSHSGHRKPPYFHLPLFTFVTTRYHTLPQPLPRVTSFSNNENF